MRAEIAGLKRRFQPVPLLHPKRSFGRIKVDDIPLAHMLAFVQQHDFRREPAPAATRVRSGRGSLVSTLSSLRRKNQAELVSISAASRRNVNAGVIFPRRGGAIFPHCRTQEGPARGGPSCVLVLFFPASSVGGSVSFGLSSSAFGLLVFPTLRSLFTSGNDVYGSNAISPLIDLGKPSWHNIVKAG